MLQGYIETKLLVKTFQSYKLIWQMTNFKDKLHWHQGAHKLMCVISSPKS